MSILHRTVKFQAIVPRYATRFSCLGPQCEDNCCREWEVPIDRKTRDAYTRSLHPQLGPTLRGVVADPPGPRTKNDDGRLMWNASTGACMLLKDGLCAVHAELGPTHLSHTCFTYPRHWMDVDGQRQETLSLSCPEAARLALLAPDAFEFVEAGIDVRDDIVGKHRADPRLDAALAAELRIFCLNLVRLDGLPVWQRLAVLGLFCDSVSEPLARHDNEAVRALLDGFAAMLEQGELRDTLASFQPDYEAQALVFSSLWSGMPLNSGSPVRNAVVADVVRGLGADPDTGHVTPEALADAYRHGMARLPAALEAAPHLLEHYLLNEMFQNVFPFDGATAFQGYLRLVARFGLLRLMLAARCNTGGTLPDAEALAQTARVHARRLNHDLPFLARLDRALADSGWGRLDKLVGLLPD